MTYIEKLKDPRWQKKRLKILERDRFCCNACMNGDETLHVHHLKYIHKLNPWEYKDEYLIALCDNCHKTLHIIDLLIKREGLSKHTIELILDYTQNG